MKGINAVITGGAGFIGSNLARTLAKDYNEIIVIDNLSTGSLKNIEDLIKNRKIRFIRGDITNLRFLNKVFKDIDYVFHEAAVVSISKSIEDPVTTNNVNIGGTLNVLLAARNNSVKKVVYASSCAVYGDSSELPLKENMQPKPLSSYAVSKLAGEHYCQLFSKLYGLPTVSLRYFNVYGMRQSPLIEYAAVIPRFITQVLNNKPPVIYGDGKQTRDFVFIEDVVHANVKAAETKVTGVFNIGSGKHVSINDLAKLIIKISDKQLNPIHSDPQPKDIKHSLADVSKAREKLHYRPKTKLKNGLKETMKWFQKMFE